MDRAARALVRRGGRLWSGIRTAFWFLLSLFFVVVLSEQNVLAGNIDDFVPQRLMTKAASCTYITSLKRRVSPRRMLRRWLPWQLKKVADER